MADTIPLRLTATQLGYLINAIKTADPDIQTALNLHSSPGVKLAIRLQNAMSDLQEQAEQDNLEQLGFEQS